MNIDVLHCSNLPVIKFPTYTVIRRTIRQPQDEIMKTILLFFVLIPFRIPWVHGRYIKRPISDKIVLKLLNYRYLILRDRKKRLCQAESACISSQSYKIKYVWLSFNGFAAADASLVHLLSTCTLILAQVYIGPSDERVVWVQLHAVGRSCDSSCMLCSQYPPPHQCGALQKGTPPLARSGYSYTETVPGCANCACLMRGRRDEASVTHLL